MRRTAGDVDHRQPRKGTVLGRQQTALLVAVELQAAGVATVLAAGDDPAVSPAGADRQHMPSA